MPSIRYFFEADLHRCISGVHGIHQDLGQIQECVMRIELSTERTVGVGINFVLDDCARLCALNLPAALIQSTDGNRRTGAISRSYPVHVLGKVADLIERVPDRKLKLPLRGAGGKRNLDLNQMLLRERK